MRGVRRPLLVGALCLALVISAFTVTPSARAASAEGGAIGWGMTLALGTNGTVTDDSTAIPVVAALQSNGDDTYIDISAGDATGCALAASGQAYCWGDNTYGQVGNGVNGGVVTVATPVVTRQIVGGTFASIETGAAHACGVTSASKAYCWGINGQGRLGIGSLTPFVMEPVEVRPGSNHAGGWKQVNAGSWFTCGIGANDLAYCWGSGSEGKLGNGSTSNSDVPSRVLGGPYRTVSAGVGHACAVTTSMTIDCWGSNASGQLGNGTLDNSRIPVPVILPSGAQAWDVQVGSNYTCARLTDNRLMCWGDNSYGQLGIGPDFVGFAWPSPMYVGWQKWRYISTGSLTTCAVDFDSSLPYCWGYNGSGQIGDGTRIDRASPTAVTTSGVIGSQRVSDISTGLRVQSGYLSTGTLALARPASDFARLASASTLAVGITAPGTSTTSSLLFTNTGNVPMQVGAPFWRITGQHASVFAVTADTCSGQIVAVGGTCSVSVTATPPASGPSIAQLAIDPATSPPGEEQVVYLSVVGTRTEPTYATRTWWVAQSSSAPPVLGSGSSCAAPDAVGSDDAAIRSVLALVSADDTVHVCSGTYDITSTLAIDDSITVQGDAASTTILDANSLTQIMRLLDYGVNSSTIPDPEVTVQDLTLREGAAGVPASPSELSCNLFPVCGGAMYAEDGSSLTVIDSILQDNTAAGIGGAIGSDGTNDGYDGGMIDVRTSTFVGNAAGVDGGAIGINFNFKGGGQGHPIDQSTFVGNQAMGRSGGAVAMVFSDARVTGSTFLDNTAAWQGDAIYGGVTVSGSLLASVTPGNLCDGGSSATLSVASDGSCGVSAASYSNLAIIGLGDWGGPTPTVWIGPGSTAVDANSGTCSALDQRGATRSAPPCDAGSFERRSGSAQALTSTLDYPGTVALTESVAPLSAPAVAAAAPAPTYEVASGGCTVDASSGAVTGVTTGTCTIDWTIAATLTQDGAQGDDSVIVVKQDQPALAVVAPAQASINATVTLSTTGGAGTGAVTYDVGASTVCTISGDVLSLGGTAGTCTVTATKAGDSTYNSQTSAAVSIAVGSSTPRPPGPIGVPPAAPVVPAREQAVVAGDRSLGISWSPPNYSGSSDVTRYEVSTDPGSDGCLVAAPQTSCRVTGLTNGVAYAVRVRAGNAAGWGPWALLATDATPQGIRPVESSIMITGSRVGPKRDARVRVVGTSEGLEPGQVLQPWIALGTRTKYTRGLVTVTVGDTGGFTWSRRTGKFVSIYFATADGVTRSNKVTIH